MYSVTMEKDLAAYRDSVEGVEVRLPARHLAGFVEITEPPAMPLPGGIAAAFEAPVGSPPLRELARGARRVAVIVSDATRGVPTALVLPHIVSECAAAGVSEDRIVVVVALGVHRGATEAEMREILGGLSGRIAIENHEPFDASRLVFLGTTSRGTPVEVNRTVVECDLRVAVGKVEPHEFAGFSAGRKSVLPGVCSERTILVNHRPEMILHPLARTGQMEGNPISEDMVEAAKLLGRLFTVNLAVNAHNAPVACFAGDLEAAHERAVAFLRGYLEVRLETSPDVILTTPGRPLNCNFYQAIKPLIACEPLLAEGGVMALYAECCEGCGTEDMFIPYAGATCPAEVTERLKGNYRIQMDHALLLCKIMGRGLKIVAHSPHVEAAAFRSLFIEPAASPQAALDAACAMSGKPDPRVLIFPQPQRTLPVLGRG